MLAACGAKAGERELSLRALERNGHNMRREREEPKQEQDRR
jgi:hypothetical protein